MSEREKIKEFTLFADTWPEFLELVRITRASMGNPKVVWYRGMSNANYRLVPSLLRNPSGLEKEREVFDDYERVAAHLNGPRTNDWAMLFDMQHYGIPTRLLDWTDVLGVAVAFALYEANDDSGDSSIHVLDPIRLNQKSGKSGILRPTNDEKFQYKSVYWDNAPFKAVYPIAIDGPLQNHRMIAQSGAFTVHGSDLDFFDGTGQDCVQKIILGPKAKPAAREFLEHANLNPFSLYPDLFGMARHIVRKHFA
jgi:hypothetical protein